jgi:hypothetical protein
MKIIQQARGTLMIDQTQETAMQADELAGRWAHAWGSTDHEEMAALFVAEGSYTDLAVGRTFTGRDEITGFVALSHVLVADLHIEVLDAVRGGDQVTIETTYSGHFRGAPAPFAVRGTTTVRLQGDRIAGLTDSYDVASILAQSGLPADWTPTGS